METAVVLVNTGSPLSYAEHDVEAYLKEFLLDPRILELPWLLTQLIVRLLIVPLRKKKVAKAYQEIWKGRCAPLIEESDRVRKALQDALGDAFYVTYAMRYGSPSIENVMKTLEKKEIASIILIPLFPQFASETVGSIMQQLMHEISSWNKMPTISWIHSFHNHPLVQEAFIKRIQQHDLASYDHILFSFHGLPERNILKQNRQCLKNDCCANNTHCYRAQCLNTCTTLANKLNLAPDRWSMSFQSRLGVNKWLSPYTNKTVKELARKGVKKLLVVCPAFVADCLETVYEIGVELKKEFVKDGGCAIDLVEGLNASSSWIFALQSMIMETVCSNTRYRA